MKVVAVEHRDNPITEQRLLVMRQQEIVAKLARAGQKQGAREARGKLFALLNQLDLMQELSLPGYSSGHRQAG